MKYVVNDVEYDTDSTVNQHIISDLVYREVYCCMTTEMEYILDNYEECVEMGIIDDDESLYNTEDEIFEWWAVSDWLGDKLRQNGAVVLDSYGKSYWGRTTTGQAIALDYVITKVAMDMGILDGMEYSWNRMMA